MLDIKTTFFTQDEHGNTLFMLSSLRDEDNIDKLINSIKDLPSNDQYKLVKIIWKEALIYADEGLFSTIVGLIRSLNETFITQLFLEDYEAATLLMTAISTNSKHLPCLVELFESLPDESKATILTTRNASYQNVLLLVLHHQPDYTPAILRCINPLPVETKMDIFTGNANAFFNTLIESKENVKKALEHFDSVNLNLFFNSYSNKYWTIIVAYKLYGMNDDMIKLLTFLPVEIQVAILLDADSLTLHKPFENSDSFLLLLSVIEGWPEANQYEMIKNILFIGLAIIPSLAFSIVDILVRRQTPNTLRRLFTEVTNRETILFTCLTRYPHRAYLAGLLNIITGLSDEVKSAILSIRDEKNKNVILWALEYSPQHLKNLFDIIKPLPTDLKNPILLNNSGAVVSLLESVRVDSMTLVQKCGLQGLELFFTSQSSETGDNLLMEAVRNGLPLTKLLDMIYFLPIEIRNIIFTQTNDNNENVLLLACMKGRQEHLYCDENEIINLLSATQRLSTQSQSAIFQTQEKTMNISFLQFAYDNFTSTEIGIYLPKVAKTLSLKLQYKIIYDPSCIHSLWTKDLFKRNLAESLNTLTTDSALYNSLEIAHLESRLRKMIINSKEKQAAVLDAYNRLKYQSEQFPKNLVAALSNPESEINTALGKTRLPGLFNRGEATSVKRLRDNPQNTRKSSQIKCIQEHTANIAPPQDIPHSNVSVERSLDELRTLLLCKNSLKPKEIEQVRALGNQLFNNKTDFLPLFDELLAQSKPNKESIVFVFRYCVKAYFVKLRDAVQDYDINYLNRLTEKVPANLVKHAELQDIALKAIERTVNLYTQTEMLGYESFYSAMSELKKDALFSASGMPGSIFKRKTAQESKINSLIAHLENHYKLKGDANLSYDDL